MSLGHKYEKSTSLKGLCLILNLISDFLQNMAAGQVVRITVLQYKKIPFHLCQTKQNCSLHISDEKIDIESSESCQGMKYDNFCNE